MGIAPPKIEVLRAGCPWPRPWSHSSDLALIRTDVAAAKQVARHLGCDLHVVYGTDFELRTGLEQGHIDVVFGSLIFPPPSTVRVLHVPSNAQDRCARALSRFPNTWWVRNDARLLAFRLQWTLNAVSERRGNRVIESIVHWLQRLSLWAGNGSRFLMRSTASRPG